jgi:hypothetical protein
MAPDAAVPACFFSATRTADELSIVCIEAQALGDALTECGWRIFQVIFAISTFDTDYVLVKEENLAKAVDALRAAGHLVV